MQLGFQLVVINVLISYFNSMNISISRVLHCVKLYIVILGSTYVRIKKEDAIMATPKKIFNIIKFTPRTKKVVFAAWGKRIDKRDYSRKLFSKRIKTDYILLQAGEGTNTRNKKYKFNEGTSASLEVTLTYFMTQKVTATLRVGLTK